MNSHQGTVLRRMCQQGNVDLAKQIVDAGANVDAAQEDGCTALWLASEAGHLAVIQMLCAAGANISAMKTPGNVSSLYVAAQNGHVGIVDLLLMNGANPNAAKQNGSTPLHIASQQGYVDICRLLLRFGAKHSARNAQGVIPLHLAAYQGNEKVVRLLLAAGADPHSESQGKFTLDWAESNGYGPMIQRAIEDHTGERMIKDETEMEGDIDFINESSVTAGGIHHQSIVGSPAPGSRSTHKSNKPPGASALKQPFFVQMRDNNDRTTTYDEDERNHQDLSGWYVPQFLNRSGGGAGSPSRSVHRDASVYASPAPTSTSTGGAASSSATKPKARSAASAGFSATTLPLNVAIQREAARNAKFRSQVMKNPYDGSHEAFYSGEKFNITSTEDAYDVHSGWEHYKKRLKNQGRFLNNSKGNVSDGWMYSGNAIQEYGRELQQARAQLASSAVERKSDVSASTNANTSSIAPPRKTFTAQNSCVGLDERYVGRLREFLIAGEGAQGPQAQPST